MSTELLTSTHQSQMTGPFLPSVIGLCGKMGCGKDTVGALLSMVGYIPIAWAGALRREVVTSLLRQQQPPMPEDVRSAWFRMTPEDVYAKPTSNDARKVLQFWGTEHRRQEDPLYWIKALAAQLEPDQKYAVTDTRFANEARFIQERGGQVWMIERPDQGLAPGIAGHSSEQFEGIDPNVVLQNTGSITELAKTVRRTLAI